jgi:dihydrodipicolinate synthase/N-acetylneuraminate lyase
MSRYLQTMLGTVCVPWTEEYSFDEELFREEIRYLIENDLRDLYIFGTAGEGYAISDKQFDEITRAFVAEMNTYGATPMVGAISLSLSTIIERIERAMELGVRAFQLSLPSWGALCDKEVQSFFRETCGRFPNSQFLHYNLLRSKRLVTPQEYSRLAEEFPNLVATKHGTPDANLAASLLRDAPQLRHFFTEPCFPYASLMGEPGFLVSIASINPKRAREYFEAGVRRDASTLMALQRELLAMTKELMRVVGGEAHMDGAFDKIFCKLHNDRFPLRLLPPYASASEETFGHFQQALSDDFKAWLR